MSGGTIERYITFDHGTDPLDAGAADLHANYVEARKHRDQGQGIAAMVFEYSHVEVVDESYAVCEECGSANCRRVDPDGCEPDCTPDADEPPAPSFIVGNGPDGRVQIDGQPVDLARSIALREHSITGFAWGYLGSGPAQLALAILLHLGMDESEALQRYQQFKSEVVARWPFGKSFIRPVSDVRAWIDAQRSAA